MVLYFLGDTYLYSVYRRVPLFSHVPRTNANRDGKKYSNRNNIVVLQTSFSVDLNDISTGPDKPFYALATSHVTRLNMFQLSSVLYFEDGTENEEFFSKPFRITTTPLPKAATTSVSSPIPSPEFRNTHIEVQTLVSDLVFASHVKVKNMTSKPSLDLGADKVLLF